MFYLEEVHKEFYCARCRQNINIKNVVLRASSLPKSEFSEKVEKFLTPWLMKTNLKDKIVVRLLADNLDVYDKLPEFAKMTNSVSYPFQHHNIFVFYELEGKDACIFNVQFQLHGSNSDTSNKNCAYLSFIDSVCLIEYSKTRSMLYKNILLCCFQFFKMKGYEKVYLWSCPPKKGRDYIFVS